MPRRKTTKISPQEEAGSYGVLAGIVGFLLAYFIAEAALFGRPHPLHWLAAFSAAALAGIVAYQISLRRNSTGDDHAKKTKQ